MNKTELGIGDRVENLLMEQLCLKSIHRNNKLKEALGADSLDYVEIEMVIEEEFDIEFSIDDFESVVTVQDVVDLVNKKLDG